MPIFKKSPSLAATGRTSVEAVEQELAKARVSDAHTDKWLRRFLGYGSLIAIAAQLAVADLVFFKYGHAKSWLLDTGALEAWLAAVVIQLFIIVRGIGSYLFPHERRRSLREVVLGDEAGG
jgi:hypothetical protein